MEKIAKLSEKNRLIFPIIIWLLSRGIIIIAMLIIAPLLPAPPGGIQAEFGWEVFSAWDSESYRKIATFGYFSDNNQLPAEIAFFPLLPLAINLLMRLGFSFEIAGTLINNLAFFGTLIILYQWVEKFHGITVARWVTAVFAFNPFSIFGTVIYTEGLFFFFSTLALKSFDDKRYFLAAFSGALATATRITGLALIPAFIIMAWLEKRSIWAYIAAILTSLGTICYGIYCWITLNNPLAFISVQFEVWQVKRDYWGQAWVRMLAQLSVGNTNWNYGEIKDILHPLLFLLICGIGCLLWCFREKVGVITTGNIICFLVILMWILGGDPFINTATIFGGIYLLWYARNKISQVAIFYGLFTLPIILSSGRTTSVERYVYGIISVSIALGFLLENHPRWGYALMGFFTVLLASFGVRFAQHLWVA